MVRTYKNNPSVQSSTSNSSISKSSTTSVGYRTNVQNSSSSTVLRRSDSSGWRTIPSTNFNQQIRKDLNRNSLKTRPGFDNNEVYFNSIFPQNYLQENKKNVGNGTETNIPIEHVGRQQNTPTITVSNVKQFETRKKPRDTVSHNGEFLHFIA